MFSGASSPSRWGLWWALDGNDTRDSLTSLDRTTMKTSPIFSFQSYLLYASAYMMLLPNSTSRCKPYNRVSCTTALWGGHCGSFATSPVTSYMIRNYRFWYLPLYNHIEDPDGKGMQCSNHLEGCKCWVCPYDTADMNALVPQDSVSSDQVYFEKGNIPFYTQDNKKTLKVPCNQCEIRCVPARHPAGAPRGRLLPLRREGGERHLQAVN